jgi:hypothetical protein
MNHAHNTELIDLLRMTSQRLSQFTNDKVTHTVISATNKEPIGHIFPYFLFNEPGTELFNDILSSSFCVGSYTGILLCTVYSSRPVKLSLGGIIVIF